jgi:hypothetical protein
MSKFWSACDHGALSLVWPSRGKMGVQPADHLYGEQKTN